MKMKQGHPVPSPGGGQPPVPKPSTSTRFTHQELQSVLPAPTKSGGRVEYECPKCSRPHLQFFGVDSFKCWGEKCDTSEVAKILRVKLAAKNKARTPKKPPPGITLQQYAEQKRLPVEFLKTEFGLYDTKYMGDEAVAFVYDDGTLKFRVGPASKYYFWKKGKNPQKLPPNRNATLERHVEEQDAVDAVLIVGGDATEQTLWDR